MLPKKKNTVEYVVFGAIAYLALIVFTLHYSALKAANPEMDLFVLLNTIPTHILQSPFDIVFDFELLGVVTLAAVLGTMMVVFDNERNHHDAAGIEAGSAGWLESLDKFNEKYNSPFGKKNNDGKDNMILSQNVRLSMNGSKTRRNCNIMVLGGSGSGKSRFFVKPNLLQENASYVVTDPKGELLETCGGALTKAEYEIKVFNTIEFQYSSCYNPFHYLHTDTDIIKMVNCLMENTNAKGSSSGDPFWTNSERALLTAICLFLVHRCPEEDCNWSNVIRLLELAEINEENPKEKSVLDVLFIILETDMKKAYGDAGLPYVPDLANRQYSIYKMAAGKTAKSILISAGVRLAPFQIPAIAHLTSKDTIDLTTIGDKKTALFCVISASDASFNFLVAMLYTQLFDELYLHAQNKYGGSLPINVRFLLDEFANIGQIPDFDKKLATMRSYKISCSIILQSISQLKALYKDDWETLVGNCDTKIFLGGNDESTTKYISGILGKTTITGRSRGRSMGKSGSSSVNFQQQARDLMSPDELGLMDNNYCCVMVRGEKAIYDKKYDYPKHPRYKDTGDADKKQMYPFRQIYQEILDKEKREEEAEREKKRASELSRKERNKRMAGERRNRRACRQVASMSSGGVPCMWQQDAAEELAKNPNRKETLYDAHMTDELDPSFEFRGGKELTEQDLWNYLSDCGKLAAAVEQETVEIPEVEGQPDDLAEPSVPGLSPVRQEPPVATQVMGNDEPTPWQQPDTASEETVFDGGGNSAEEERGSVFDEDSEYRPSFENLTDEGMRTEMDAPEDDSEKYIDPSLMDDSDVLPDTENEEETMELSDEMFEATEPENPSSGDLVDEISDMFA